MEKAKEKSKDKNAPYSSYAQLTPIKDYCEKVRQNSKAISYIVELLQFIIRLEPYFYAQEIKG